VDTQNFENVENGRIGLKWYKN